VDECARRRHELRRVAVRADGGTDTRCRLDGGGVRVVIAVIVEPVSSSHPRPLAPARRTPTAEVENLCFRDDQREDQPLDDHPT
jgi:hypothetical protein